MHLRRRQRGAADAEALQDAPAEPAEPGDGQEQADGDEELQGRFRRDAGWLRLRLAVSRCKGRRPLPPEVAADTVRAAKKQGTWTRWKKSWRTRLASSTG